MFEVIVEQFFPSTSGGRGYSSERVAGKCETEQEAKIKVASLKNEHTGEYYISYRKMKEMKEEVIMTRITALEARKLAGPTVQERVDEVYPLIREAAKKGDRSLALHDSFWVHDGYSKTDAYKQACMILEGDGFQVSFYYEERQFVDMYTIVEW